MASRVGKPVSVEKLVVQWLTGFDANVRVVTKLPETLPADGVVWVKGLGGFSDWDQARIRVDIQILIPGEDGDADDIAAAVQTQMDNLGGTSVNGQYVHLVRFMNTWTRHFWAEDVDRLTGTFELTLPVLL